MAAKAEVEKAEQEKSIMAEEKKNLEVRTKPKLYFAEISNAMDVSSSAIHFTRRRRSSTP